MITISIGDYVIVPEVNNSRWYVFNINKTHAHIRNSKGATEWCLLSKLKVVPNVKSF